MKLTLNTDGAGKGYRLPFLMEDGLCLGYKRAGAATVFVEAERGGSL
jgi:hypothetical protein